MGIKDFIIKSIANKNPSSVKQLFNLLKKLPGSLNIAQTLDKKGNTILHYAATSYNNELIKLCVKYKADVNSRNKNGQTPLTIAIGGCAIEVNEDKLLTINLLLSAGAEIDQAEYKTLLHIMSSEKNKYQYSTLFEKIGKNLALLPFLSENATHLSSENVKQESRDDNHFYNSLENIYEEVREPLYDTPEGIDEEVGELHNKALNCNGAYDIPTQESPIPGKTRKLIAMFEGKSKPQASSKPSNSIPNSKILSSDSIQKASQERGL